MQRIFRLLLVVSAIVLSGFYFVHWSKTRALNSGAVHVRSQPVDQAKAANSPPSSTPPEIPSQPTPPQEVASAAGEQLRPRSQTVSVQTSETLGRHPSNGILAAAGKSKFELYRQGDLTFRLNTETGDACVLLATQDQWSNTVVYSHGCNGR